jgi:hypothetical protein
MRDAFIMLYILSFKINIYKLLNIFLDKIIILIIGMIGLLLISNYG